MTDGSTRGDDLDAAAVRETPLPPGLGRASGFGEARRRLYDRVQARESLITPGVTDALTARLVEQAGFEACYATGAGIANMQFGLPDIGLISMGEVLTQVQRITHATSLPVIVDADTGYGAPLSVMRTVHLLETAGAAAIQIEDQDIPKRCGHFDGHRLVSMALMQAKIEAARVARADDKLMIIARTDALNGYGLDEALRRGAAYIDAGADALFVEAPRNVDELRQIGAELGSVPLIANIVEGGRTPELSTPELSDLGFTVVIHASFLMRRLLKAGQLALSHLRDTGETRSLAGDILTWDERQELVHLPQFARLEDRFESAANGDGDARD